MCLAASERDFTVPLTVNAGFPMARRHGLRFSGKELELGRKYMWREEFIPLLYKYLDIQAGQRIVDVGCGTGFFTRLMARALDGRGEVIGIDRNPQLLKSARELTHEAKLDSMVTYRKGNAYKLQMQDDFADRVVCQTLLWTLPDPKPAVREMVRVCKPGGLVGAVEGGFDHKIFHFPQDSALTRLELKVVKAEAKGYQKEHGLDTGLGYKLPAVFRESGLKRIRLDGIASVWLEQDDRVPLDHKIALNRFKLGNLRRNRGFSDEDRHTLMAGGMKITEIKELERLKMNRTLRRARNSSLFETDASMNAVIRFIVTGLKPR
jgi:ubiquinone/menaquinone biosynthesis C-methylase UbiE